MKRNKVAAHLFSPFCISSRCGLLRVGDTHLQSCLLMLCKILKFMLLLDLGEMSLAYYRSFSQVKPKQQANSNRLADANCGDLVD